MPGGLAHLGIWNLEVLSCHPGPSGSLPASALGSPQPETTTQPSSCLSSWSSRMAGDIQVPVNLNVWCSDGTIFFVVSNSEVLNDSILHHLLYRCVFHQCSMACRIRSYLVPTFLLCHISSPNLGLDTGLSWGPILCLLSFQWPKRLVKKSDPGSKDQTRKIFTETLRFGSHHTRKTLDSSVISRTVGHGCWKQCVLTRLCCVIQSR